MGWTILKGKFLAHDFPDSDEQVLSILLQNAYTENRC